MASNTLNMLDVAANEVLIRRIDQVTRQAAGQRAMLREISDLES